MPSFDKLATVMSHSLPFGEVWSVIREIAKENERGQEWSASQWQRFCDACDVSKGAQDQNVTVALWRTYRVVKDLLADGLGDQINTHLRMIRENIDTRVPAPMPKLVSVPRARRIANDY